MNGIFSYWGCGKGPLKSLRAHIRILSGILVGVSALMIPLQSMAGIFFIAVATICWCLLAAMPVKMLVRVSIASLVLFLPVVLLTPWMTVDSPAASPMTSRLLQAGAIALRSTCCLFVAASAIAVLSIQDIHRGLAHLPIPRTLVVLVVQLVNQTVLLAEETIRIIGVLRLRSASGSRGITVLFSFPIVWMVRMLFRAERTAAAMTVREYGIEASAVHEKVQLTGADMLAMSCASAVFIGSVLMRMGILL